MNQIVNFHAYGSRAALDAAFPARQDGTPGWVYVGRANRTHGLAASPLANRYVRRGTARRKGVIEVEDPLGCYHAWLLGCVREGVRSVTDALAAIGPETALVCWCAPKPCHAGIIAGHLEKNDAHTTVE